MHNLRTELIAATISSLKIDNNAFNIQIIKQKILHIEDKDLESFYSKLFNNDHSYTSGLDRVAKVAKMFNSREEDSNKKEAKRLINLVYAINHQVFADSQKYKTQFTELMKVIILEQMIDSKDLAVLNQVKPHYGAKLLISEINSYQDGKSQLEAFVSALKYVPSDVVQIANPMKNLRIKR